MDSYSVRALWVILAFAVPCAALPVPPDAKAALRKGWMLQSSCKIKAQGQDISSARFQPRGWHQARVPGTVLAALVADKTYPDPNFGMNLRAIPGTTYTIGTNFAHQPMPETSPFACSWWYRTEFPAPATAGTRNVWLKFQGLNYRANIWLNGRQIAESSQVAGAYRTFAFNVTHQLHRGRPNVLAVEVFAPQPSDLAINWVDWNPMPPDKNMGIWKDVYLENSGPVTLRHAFVVSRVDVAKDKAALVVSAQVTNHSAQAVNGVLKIALDKNHLQQELHLEANETKTVKFAPDRFPQLEIMHPRLWWPYEMGDPDLYDADFQFETDGAVSDSLRLRFGIREITSELNEEGNRLFTINGKKLFVRGGGWAPDMLLRQSRQRLRDEFQYVKHLHLNTIRLEGKIESEDFFNLADEEGILVMAGWCCCDIWEEWDKWQPEHHQIAIDSLRSQLLRLRTHPSVLVWLYGSDNPPPADVEREYLEVLKETEWPNPAISSASARPTEVTGPSGVKMSGPYQYVPPSYWLDPAAKSLKFGGAFGFNTETSPGPAIPVLDSLKKMLPKGDLWPIDEVWNYHAGGGEFKDLSVFNNAMDSIYGAPRDLEDYLKKSQTMAYDAERAMFEAYRRNRYSSTGVIQWMLNNAWPSMIWHLYDYYLEPGGGYFGARKANEPLHIQFSHDDRSVVLVNSEQRPFQALQANVDLYDFNLERKFSQQLTIDVPADTNLRLLTIPDSGPDVKASFVRLCVQDSTGRVLSSNFYWLPAKYSTFDWASTTYVYTPSPSYEDLTQLAQLPHVKLEMSATAATSGKRPSIQVRLHNPSKHLAFQVSLRAFNQKDGRDILPVLWDNNYFELMPGESTTVTATYDAGELQNIRPAVQVGGWNIIPQTKTLFPAPSGENRGQ